MEILSGILMIIGLIVVLCVLGLLIKLGGFILEILFDGFESCMGCLIWLIAMIIFIGVILSGL